MDPTIRGTVDALPDPEDWPTPDSSGRSPEALQNEADDLVSFLPAGATMPTEADDADLIQQLQECSPDEEDEPREG